MIRIPEPLGRAVALCMLAASVFAPVRLRAQAAPDLAGVWAAEQYLMADGGEHQIQGRIFFTDREWQVLFFVTDEAGNVKRGSAEGGTYLRVGDGLVLTHLFNLSAGEAMRGLAAQELRMISHRPADAPTEPTRIELEGDKLTLFFPSRNRMTFLRR